MTDDQRYMFKAPFKLRDKKSLLKLLKRRDLNGEGGVFFDDVNESLPKAEKIVQSLTGDGKIIQVSFLSIVTTSEGKIAEPNICLRRITQHSTHSLTFFTIKDCVDSDSEAL